MIIDEEKTRIETVLAAAREAMAAARTAPETRGIDNLIIKMVDGEDMEKVAVAMETAAAQRPEKRASFVRDAKNVRSSQGIILLGVANNPAGLDCGWCGFPDCSQKARNPGVYCVFNPMDLGIALGSTVALLAGKHIDNRLMYSIGFAALTLKLFPGNVRAAIGIPLAVAGKSPFYDRK